MAALSEDALDAAFEAAHREIVARNLPRADRAALVGQLTTAVNGSEYCSPTNISKPETIAQLLENLKDVYPAVLRSGYIFQNPTAASVVSMTARDAAIAAAAKKDGVKVPVVDVFAKGGCRG